MSKDTTPETEYPVDDLVKEARSVFGVNPECAAAALAGVATVTISKATTKVNEFMKREVK